MRVFLVDDDYEDHEIFKMALDKVEPLCEMLSAENGIEALDYFKKNSSFKPDIIFLDVNMPRMNGKECIKELRSLTDFKNIPMILYSTHDGQKEIDEAKEAGASDFMTKPASINEFAKSLRTMLARHINFRG